MVFSVKNFTRKMRRTSDADKCRPFPIVGDQTRQQIQSRLPPMDVPDRSNLPADVVLSEQQWMRNFALRRRNLRPNVEAPPPPPPSPSPPSPPPSPTPPAIPSPPRSDARPVAKRKTTIRIKNIHLLKKRVDELTSDAESEPYYDRGNLKTAEGELDTFCRICNCDIDATRAWEMNAHIDLCVEKMMREEKRGKGRK